MKTQIFAILCFSFFSILWLLSIAFIEEDTKGNFKTLSIIEPALKDSMAGSMEEYPQTLADSLLMQARSLIESADFDSAEAVAIRSFELYNNANNRRGIVRSTLERGRVLERMGRSKEGIKLLEDNADKAKQWFGEDDLDYANNLHVLGNMLRAGGFFENSLHVTLKALEIRKSRNDASLLEIGRSLNSIGVTYTEKGYYDQGLKYYLEALEYRLKSLGQKNRDVAQSYNNIGNLLKRKGDYGRSLEYHHQALSLRRELLGDEHPEVGASYYNLGNLFGVMGEFEDAVKLHEKSYQIWLNSLSEKHPYVHLSLNSLGIDYEKMGRNDESLSKTNRTLKLQKKYLGHGASSLGGTYFNLGTVHSRFGNHIISNRYLEEALQNQFLSFGEHHPRVAQTYNSIGWNHLEMKSNDMAIDYAISAINSNRKVSMEYRGKDEADYKSYFSIEAYQQSQLLLAQAYVAKSKGLSEVEEMRYLRKALAIYKDLVQVMNDYRKSFKAESSKIFWVEKAGATFERGIHAAVTLHQRTGNESYLEDVLYFMEHSKVTVLLDALYEADARKFAQIPDSLLAQEKSFRLDISFYDNKLKEEEAKGESANKELVEKMRTRVFQLNQDYQKLITHLEREYTEYYDLKYRNYAVSVPDIRRQLLDEDEAIIEYFLGEDSLYVLAVTDDAMELSHTSSINLIDQIDRFRNAIFKSNTLRLIESGNTLYEILVLPVLDVIKDKKHLIVVPHEELNYVPFEALVTRNIDPDVELYDLPYMIWDHSFRYEYSSTLAVHDSQKPRVRNWSKDFVGFAPVFSKGIDEESAGYTLLSGRRSVGKSVELEVDGEMITWPTESDPDSAFVIAFEKNARGYLEYSDDEVSEIQALFENSYSWIERRLREKTKIYLEGEATESRLKSLDLTDYRFVHLATHGAINESVPELSGVLFAEEEEATEDGVLRLGEVYNLELNADLVALSACETGLGKLANGEGIIGLARGFKYAGANSLLVSLWPVEDASTQKLMRFFYREIIDGKDKAEAIRQAKLDFLKNSTFFYRPYYWAGFVLMGERQAPAGSVSASQANTSR